MNKKNLLFLLMLMPIMASADESGTCGNNLIWSYVDATKTLTISGTGSMTDYSYISDNKSSAPWYWYKSLIKYAIIESGVTSIGNYAFYGCSGLTSITIPNSVTSIGEYAFYDCSGLTSITIPNSVTSIGSYAFYGCRGLTSITIPNSVTSIGYKAFYDCSGLTSITIPNSVTSIGDEAFSGCSGLTSITIPNSVTSIREETFFGCRGLTSITIPNSVMSIGSYAFGSCSGLTSITIPNSVMSIGNGAFSYCSGLTSVTIPNSVTSIKSYAFYNCSGLTTIVSEIETPFALTADYVFSNYGTATLIVPPGKKSVYQNTAGWKKFTNIVEAELMGYEFENSGIRYKIGENNTVSVVSRAEKYSGDVVIPSQVSYNGSNYSVMSIGSGAFRRCSCLTSITIPNSVTSIKDWAFSGCSGLTSIKVESGNNIYDSRNNCNAIIEKSSNTLITGCQNTIIPNSVTSIGTGAFYDCSGLTTITIPNSVTSIGFDAFSLCSGLTSITIPNSVTRIVSEAFEGCSGLTTIVSEIETPFALDDVFDYGLATLIVPPGKKSVYQNTAGWKKFQNIVEAELMGYEFENNGIRYKIGENNTVSVVSRAEKYSGDVVIPSQVSYHGSNYSVTSIGGSAFEGCVDMTSVTIPSSVTTIGGAAFYYCTGLTTIDIPNGATTIGEGAFSKCEGLTSVTIPGSVTTIDSNAFFQCYALTQITSWIENPFVINSNVFPTSVYSNATLNVPSGKKTVYQNTTGWKKFVNISESSKCAKPTISYGNGKISFSCETEGVEFHYTISNTNSSTGVGSSVNFSPTVNISVYASKPGFGNSDISTAEIVVSSSLRGDLNGDGKVNVADHVELSNIILGQ